MPFIFIYVQNNFCGKNNRIKVEIKFVTKTSLLFQRTDNFFEVSAFQKRSKCINLFESFTCVQTLVKRKEFLRSPIFFLNFEIKNHFNLLYSFFKNAIKKNKKESASKAKTTLKTDGTCRSSSHTNSYLKMQFYSRIKYFFSLINHT